MNHQFEIEIKSLLGDKEYADKLIAAMKEKDKRLLEVGAHKQLNHYFTPAPSGAGQGGGNLSELYEKVKNVAMVEDKKAQLKDLSEKVKAESRTGALATGTGNFSVRTRWADGKVILVVKASVDDTTSSNGTARLEWEAKVDKTIEEMDQLVLDAGFEYQAKWSRERQEFVYHPHGREINVSIDKNAGYGYLSEFEVVVNDESKADEVKNFIRETMQDLEIAELPQDRLARMFDYYNSNWQDYYGTEKIFTIE